MDKRAWSGRILLRYTLMQIPGTVLLIVALYLIRRWVELPAWLLWGIVGLWIAKDIILYPRVWRAYDSSRAASRVYSMEGDIGIAQEPLSPRGYIRIRGELWNAILVSPHKHVEKGARVRIIRRKGLEVQVEPVEP